ncbi:amino acid adenylation domain-containing protein [Rhodococcoides fascians]|uniref:amino acid adenylation domain-containing protein n=1 Tax=Rhodococcoides fascians TaxID=1828 RepID=UPI003CE9174E
MRTVSTSPDALSLHAYVNDTDAPYLDDCTIADVFDAQVTATPDAIAVVHRETVLTYRALHERAEQMCAHMRTQGIQPGEVVAVDVARTPDLITALLAVIKSGGTYLPLDNSWPDNRIESVIGLAQCSAAISDHPDMLSARFRQLRVVSTEAPKLDESDGGRRRTGAQADSVAYICFTSGSTGTPKGVPIQHRSVMRLVQNARYARLGQGSVLLHLAPVVFDAATFEIWGALLTGGTCVLYPSKFVRLMELRRVLADNSITTLFLTTALFNLAIDEDPAIFSGLDTILTGGEAHSLKHMDMALQALGPDKIVSVYGPTEATTFATYYPVRRIESGTTGLPIGRPLQNTRVYLLRNNRLCGIGESGTLHLAGPGLSPGYLTDPRAAPDDAFFEANIDGRPERLYRTGDRAYFLDTGDLVFLGRDDDQVKINGHRIEIGEVTHHLDLFDSVKHCFVTVDDTAPDRRLVAFIVPHTAECTPDWIKSQLHAELPPYMVPSAVRLCDDFPLTPTGKIDRRTLLQTMSPSKELIS